MKKNKKIILLLLGVVLFGFLSFYFYKNSKSVTTEEIIKNKELGNINYKVYLRDNKYYDKEYLDENMSYISSIIDYIDVNFNYLSSYEDKKNFVVNKKVEAIVKIIDVQNNDKVIYTDTDIIKEEKLDSETISFVDNYKIDYKKYNDLTNEFKSNYGISAKCTVDINYIIDYKSADQKIKNNKMMTLSIPLSEQMINITKSENINNDSNYVIEATDKPINKVLILISFIFTALAIIFIFLIIGLIIKKEKALTKYDKYIRKILRDYDAYITESSDKNLNMDKKVIKINSFKELLDVRNNIEKAIIYIKVDENKSKFLIIDEEIYEYQATREEIEKA